ncbi:MAG: GerAB/ArcD/ProY family transporter [Bacillota bacterium]|nr:GerAB/ArcD/ProY family transporter [Bacillota bacterium]
MANNSSEKVGVREFGSMILISISIKLSDTTPVFLFQRAKTAGWMLPIIAGMIMFPSLIIMLSLFKRYEDKNLIDILNHLMGRFFGGICGSAVALIVFSLMVTSSRDIMDSITIMFYPKTPPIVIYLIFMSAAVFICRRGVEAVGGVCWFMIPVLIFETVAVILLTIPDMRPGYIFPIGGIKPLELIKGIPFYASYESEVIMVGGLFTVVKSYRDYARGTITALILGSVIISISSLTYLLVFDVEALQHIPFPFLELTRIIRIGRFISNAEAIFFGFWIIAESLRLTVYLYIITYTFSRIFRLNEIKPFFPLVAVLSICISLFPENFATLVFNTRRVITFTASVVLIPLPYVLLLLSRMKGEEGQ